MAVHRLALAEAHPDVALEANVVTGRELERVETGQETVRFGVVLPVTEDARFRRASVLVRHDVLVLDAVFHRFGDAAASESSVDCCWLNLDLQSQIVTDLSGDDLLSVEGDDAHSTRWWWTGISDGTGRRQHLYVEAKRDVLLSGLVHALDVVGLGLVRDQFRMFLYDQHEAGDAVDVDQTTAAEVNLEDLRPLGGISGKVHHSSALFVLAVALHVQHSVEVGLHQVDHNLNAIRLARHLHFRLWEVGAEVCCLIAMLLWITGVPCDTLADRLMVRCITESILSANLGLARVFASSRLLVAVAPVGTVAIACALGNSRTDTFATFRQLVAVIDRADATTSLVDHHATLQRTHATSRFVNLEAILLATNLTVLVDGQPVARWASALTVRVTDESSVRWTEGHLVALDGRVSLIARQALANHRPHRERVQHLAHRVDAARLGHVARVDTFSLYASRLRRTLAVGSAPFVTQHTSADRIRFEWWRTGAFRSVLVHLAQFVLGADCLALARVLTLLVDARLVQRALGIGSASQQFAADPGISFIPRHTLTDCSVVLGVALGLTSTRI